MRTLVFAAVLFAAAAQKPAWLGIGISLHETSSAKWLYVRAIDPDGPAAAAGLRVADVITAIDGKAVAFPTNAAVLHFFGQLKPGTTLAFTVIRQQSTLTIRVRALPLPDKYAPRRDGNWRYAEEHDRRH
jgi:S1-C subfamily serine protease